MSAEIEIDYLLIFIWEDSGVVESQTMLLCYEVKPYQKNLWLHTQDQRGISEKRTAGWQALWMWIMIRGRCKPAHALN